MIISSQRWIIFNELMIYSICMAATLTVDELFELHDGVQGLK